jgi:tetratricopeptide (TPR) repeat protein
MSHCVTLRIAGSLVAGLLALPLHAQETRASQVDLASIWNDATFQRQFVGAYGINAEVEPRVTADEVKILEKVRPLMAENLAKAEAILLKAMEPDCSAMLDQTLGSIRFQLDKLPEALQSYQRAVEKFPSFRRAWRNVGHLHARNGDYDEAIHAFTRMIELGGGDSSSYGMLGAVYAAKEDYQAAEVAYRNALLLEPDNSDWRLRLTRCVFLEKKYPDAAALLDGLIQRYPDKPEFWQLQAETFLGMGEPLRAAENLEALDLLGKASVDYLFKLGDIYLSEELPDLAGSAYARAIEADTGTNLPRSLQAVERLAARGGTAQARALIAGMRTRSGPEPSEDDRRRLLELDARLGMSEGGSSPEMVALLEEIVALDPLDGEALMLLGQHHAKNGEPDRALLYYQRAGNVESFEGRAKLQEAQVLIRLQRYSDAVPLLRRCQELEPRDDVARLLEQVERFARSARR